MRERLLFENIDPSEKVIKLWANCHISEVYIWHLSYIFLKFIFSFLKIFFFSNKIFGNKHCIQKQSYKITKEDLIKYPGRQKLLMPPPHKEIVKVIQYYHDNHQYLTYDEITEFIFERFSVPIDIESCRKYIQNNCHLIQSLEFLLIRIV